MDLHNGLDVAAGIKLFTISCAYPHEQIRKLFCSVSVRSSVRSDTLSSPSNCAVCCAVVRSCGLFLGRPSPLTDCSTQVFNSPKFRPVATFRHEEAVASSFLVVCANFGPDWPLLFKVHEI